MDSRKRTKKINITIVILFLSIIPIRYFNYEYCLFSYNPVICIIFTVVTFLWILQIQRRVTHPIEKKYLIAIAILNLFLIAVRTIKYVFVVDNMLCRIMWYCYYIPIVFSAPLMLCVVYYVGKPHYTKVNRKLNYIFLPAAVLSLIILSNDYNQLMFKFNGPQENWSDAEGSYRVGIFFYITLAWTVIIIFVVIFALLKKCMIPENRKKIWMPLIPFAFCNVLLILVKLFPEVMLIKMPEIHCFMYPAIMESLIIAGLIPSNEGHMELWKISSVKAGAMDYNNFIHFTYKYNNPVNCRQVISALNKPVDINDNKSELKSFKISGGYGFWIRDISDIIKLRKRLVDAGDLLKEENSILKAEKEIEEKRVKYQEQNRLYDNIAVHVHSQLNKIDMIIHKSYEDEDSFRKGIKYACILNAYVKRYSNMIIAGEKGSLYADELKLALTESLEYINFFGILAHGDYSGTGVFDTDRIIGIYKCFEDIVEEYVETTNAILINFNVYDNKLSLNIQLDGLFKEQFYNQILLEGKKKHIDISCETDDQTIYFHLLSGGESK